ncbi:hypothetical protein OG689_43990 [Kitasatospora sp. NBC_00240]|uniref:hypothetical protein n=1 Tax=Kitasatospora sp. NBC_00240 TaxID=2903567 RepID=UPI00225AC6D1|nr:hypothetical protein [Kitasatospora sp. NBC_00240]MCX5216098.1 hypothetical protein [Kitasatospora sp. NBC_00240]
MIPDQHGPDPAPRRAACGKHLPPSGRGRPRAYCDTARRSAAYRRRRTAPPAAATATATADMVLPNITGTPSEQLPAIAEALADDVHLYLDALQHGDADDAEQLLADLHQDWPAVLDRLLEQARLAHAEHAQPASAATPPASRPPTPHRAAQAAQAGPDRSPANREKWASLLDDTPTAPPPPPTLPTDRHGPTDTEHPLPQAGPTWTLRTWSSLGERPTVHLVKLRSLFPDPEGWVEYGLTGPHWSAILLRPAGDPIHLLDFLDRPQRHATAQLAALAVVNAFQRGLSLR